MYYENSCPLNEYINSDKDKDKKPKKKEYKDTRSSLLNVVSKRHGDYTFENKRMLKSIFKIFDKNEFFIVKHLDEKHKLKGKNKYDYSLNYKDKDNEKGNKFFLFSLKIFSF
jgi:hypothetical protein